MILVYVLPAPRFLSAYHHPGARVHGPRSLSWRSYRPPSVAPREQNAAATARGAMNARRIDRPGDAAAAFFLGRDRDIEIRLGIANPC